MPHDAEVRINGLPYVMRDCVTTEQARRYAQTLTDAGRTVIRSHHMVYWERPMSRDEIIERMVDRMLYTIEQYTAGATVAVSTLDDAHYDAMREACEAQLTSLLAACIPLAQPAKEEETQR